MRHITIGMLAVLALTGVGCGAEYDEAELPEGELTVVGQTVWVRGPDGQLTCVSVDPATALQVQNSLNSQLNWGATVTGGAVNPVALPQDPEPWHGADSAPSVPVPGSSDGTPPLSPPGPK